MKEEVEFKLVIYLIKKFYQYFRGVKGRSLNHKNFDSEKQSRHRWDVLKY